MLMYERTAELDALIMDFAFVVQTRDVQADHGSIAAADASAG